MRVDRSSRGATTAVVVAVVAVVALVAASCSKSVHVAVPTTTTTTFPKVSIPSAGASTSTTAGAANGGPCRVPGAPFASTGPHYAATEIDGVQYGPGRRQLLDIHEPAGSSSGLHPAVLAVHGGGWTKGGRKDVTPVSDQLAQSGFVVFNADYDLATPGNPGYPMQVEELQQAVDWIRTNAATYHVDPTRIGALGGSAGGTLVGLLASGPGPCTGGSRVAAVVSLSGPMDLHTLDATPFKCIGNQPCHEINYTAIDTFVGCMGSATQCATPLEQASPSDHVGPGTAPMALFNSNKEVIPQSQAQDMDHTLSQSAVPQQVTIIQGVRHSFAYANSVMPAAIAFLHTWLG
jgi:acetyl esterase/lipase